MRTRTLVNKSLTTPWDLNVIGIDHQIPTSNGTYDIKDYFTDSEIDDMLQQGTLVLSADNVLRVDTIFGTLDMESGIALLGITALADASYTGGASKVMVTDASGDLDIGATRFFKGVAAPVEDYHMANKGYVDAMVEGLDPKDACVAATTPTTGLVCTYNGTTKRLTATNNEVLAMDDVNPPVGARVLIKDLTGLQAKYNGIFTVIDAGSAGTPWILQRAHDFDESSKVSHGAYTVISGGTINYGTGWVLSTPDPITLDTTDLTFMLFSIAGSYHAGTGMTLTGTKFNVGDGTTGKRYGIEFLADDIKAAYDNTTIKINGNGELYVDWVSTKGQKRITLFSEDGTVKNQYLRMGMTLCNNSGLRLMRGIKITGVSIQLSESGTCTVQLRKRDGAGGAITTVNSNLITVTAAYGANSTSVTQDTFTAGEEVLIFISNTVNIKNPVVEVEYEVTA